MPDPPRTCALTWGALGDDCSVIKAWSATHHCPVRAGGASTAAQLETVPPPPPPQKHDGAAGVSRLGFGKEEFVCSLHCPQTQPSGEFGA